MRGVIIKTYIACNLLQFDIKYEIENKNVYLQKYNNREAVCPKNSDG